MKKVEISGLLNAPTESTDPLLDYREGVIDLIRQESGLTDLSDLILYMYLVYHPNWTPQKRRGAKIKWSDFLNSAVAAEVHALKSKHKSRHSVIEDMACDPRWAKMIKKDSKSPFDNISGAEKDGKKLDLYKPMVSARKFAVDNNDLNRYYKYIDLAIQKALKKN